MTKQPALTSDEIEELARTFLGPTWQIAGRRLRVTELTRPVRTM
ncbi:hypothetical protein [Streptomyces sp. NPDC057909]